jgi:hypothetical protein
MTATTMRRGPAAWLRDDWKRLLRGWRPWGAGVALLIVAGTVVAVATAPTTGTNTLKDEAASRLRAPYASTTETASGGAAAMPAAGATKGVADAIGVPQPMPPVGDGRVADTGPRVIRTAQLTLRVRDGAFERAVDRASTVAAAAGGFVVSSNSSTLEAGKASGDLVIRVPADAFDRVRRDLAGLGSVEAVSQSGEDVAAQLVDLDARLRTLRAEESALQAILGRAKTIGETLQVRDRLTAVRTEIEQYAGQQASLRDRVAFATITVSLHEGNAGDVVPQPPEPRTGIAASFHRAADATVAVAGGMLIVVGALLPFAVLALLAWLALRRRVRTAAA